MNARRTTSSSSRVGIARKQIMPKTRVETEGKAARTNHNYDASVIKRGVKKIKEEGEMNLCPIGNLNKNREGEK